MVPIIVSTSSGKEVMAKNKRVSPDVDDNLAEKASDMRTVSADPGLLSNEELLKKLPGNRRFTLEQIIANDQLLKKKSSLTQLANTAFKKARKRVRWFVDHAQIKISVSDTCLFE